MTSRNKAFLGLLFCGSMLAGVASAQELTTVPAPRIPVDAHGVNVITGEYNVSETLATAGPSGAGGLAATRSYVGVGWIESYIGTVNTSGSGNYTTYTVTIGASTDTFSGASNNYVNLNGSNSTFTYNSTNQTSIYTLGDGTTFTFGPAQSPTYNSGPWAANVGRLTQIKHPDGQLDTYNYHNYKFCSGGGMQPQVKTSASTASSAPSAASSTQSPSSTQMCTNVARLDSISNNLGYSINLTYSDGGDTTVVNVDHFQVLAISGSAGIQTTYSYAQNGSNTGTNNGLVTRAYSFASSNGRLSTVTTGTTSPITNTVTYDSSNRVSTWSDGVATYTYTYSDNGNERATTVAGPSGNKTYMSNVSSALVDSYSDELNHTTSYYYDPSYRLTSVQRPGNDRTNYAYDSRGNLTTTTLVGKDGSSQLQTTASFDASCTVLIKCNKPNYTTDAKGLETDYAYDSTHGGVTSVTSPAPSSGAVRPQTRYTYAGLPAGGVTLYRLQTISTCATRQSCSGSVDETRTTLGYKANTVSTTDYLPLSSTVAAGDGSLSAATSFTWDGSGNLLTTTGSLGSGYTTRYLYGAANQLLGAIGPQPVAGGSLHYRAARYTYNDAGETVTTEQGITSGQQDADFQNFSSLVAVQSLFDIRGLKTSDQLVVGGAVQRLTQYGYNTRGLPQCTAVRVPVSPSSLPNACSTTPNSAQERITQQGYDAVGNRTLIIEGQGSSDATYTYQATFGLDNEQLTTQDANGNTTSFGYDTFNRLTAVNFPAAASGATAQSESYAYDANSNRTQLTRRGGAILTYGYDNLNRVVSVTQPSTAGYSNYTYAYDNLHLRQANSSQGVNYGYSYDALGRQTVESGPNGAMTSAYDAAGRRTRLTWPDGFFATYEYDQTGAMTAVREGVATSGPGVLALYGYDEQGRRVSVTRGNGSSTAYAYNAAQLLQTLTQTLPSGQGNTDTFSYSYENQLVGKTQSNDGWAWTGAYNVDRTYAANALNQQTQSGSSTLTWGAKGVLTSDGGAQSQGGTVSTYYYDIANQLFSTSGGSTQQYDAAGRIASVGSGGATRFLYDGTLAVAEYSASGGLTQRYVPGPGMDEPVAWYGNNGRNTLLADRLGSVTGVVNDSGSLAGLNTYDEYGIPGSGNVGRYQYTGQKWLPEVGLYDYKARNYSMYLGRFVQPDPGGYQDGSHLYAYVGGDPLNLTDSSGHQSEDHANPSLCALLPEICVIGKRMLSNPVTSVSPPPFLGFTGTSSNSFGHTGGSGKGAGASNGNDRKHDCHDEISKNLDAVGERLQNYGLGGGLLAGALTIVAPESGVEVGIEVGAGLYTLGGVFKTSTSLARFAAGNGNSSGATLSQINDLALNIAHVPEGARPVIDKALEKVEEQSGLSEGDDLCR